jgi:hypothetical protein
MSERRKIGMGLVGSRPSGAVVNHYTPSVSQGGLTYNWRAIWIFSATASALVHIVFLFSFSDRQTDRQTGGCGYYISMFRRSFTSVSPVVAAGSDFDKSQIQKGQ